MNEQLLYQAVGLHQAGDMAGAVRLYGEFLRANPGHFQGLYMLGFAQHQSGQFEAAAQTLGDAARVNPRSPDAHFLLGSALQLADLASVIRLVSIGAFVFLTTPVSAHVIARASYKANVPLWEGTVLDERRDGNQP